MVYINRLYDIRATLYLLYQITVFLHGAPDIEGVGFCGAQHLSLHDWEELGRSFKDAVERSLIKRLYARCECPELQDMVIQCSLVTPAKDKWEPDGFVLEEVEAITLYDATPS
jgi:hypothetical protein